jgi:hypothetical protein
MKDGTRALVEACGGGRRAATLTRSDPTYLSRYAAQHEGERFVPIDVVADLEAEVGKPIVTRILAGLLGFDLVPRRVGPATPETFTALVGAFAKETGEATAAFGAAIQDGRVTRAEGRRLLKEIDEAAEVIATARKVVRAAMPGGEH